MVFSSTHMQRPASERTQRIRGRFIFSMLLQYTRARMTRVQELRLKAFRDATPVLSGFGQASRHPRARVPSLTKAEDSKATAS